MFHYKLAKRYLAALYLNERDQAKKEIILTFQRESYVRKENMLIASRIIF